MTARAIFSAILCAISLIMLTGRAGFAATETGRLAYLHDDAVCITLAGAASQVTIPLSKEAIRFSLSTQGDGTIVFFAPRRDRSGGAATAPPLQAFFSRPPYRISSPLPIFLSKDDDSTVTWAANGDAEIGIGDLRTRRLDPKTGRLTVESEDPPTKANSHRQASAENGIIAFTDGDGRVIVESTATRQDRVLFSPTSPEPLFAALHRAQSPAKLKALADEVNPTLWKDRSNWSVGAAAMTPDRKTVFFAVNLGTGMGAQGNTSFCLFAADVRTGALAVLSKAGEFFGRVPIDCQVSPDGARLFFATSVHSSAADNSYCAYVLDLPTQQYRELLLGDPTHHKEANLMDGWCWSPNGKQVALSVLYYDPLKAANDADADPDMGKGTLEIRDAATGRLLQKIPHAHQPQWSAL